MKRPAYGILVAFFTFLCINTNAQDKRYTSANAHSHNDYLNTTPFYLAFKNGFGSIEADVFPVDGILLVAHYKKDVEPYRSLKNLYLDPLLRAFDSGAVRKLSLLVDIKENYELSLAMLIKELSAFQKYLSTPGNTNYLTVIISGSRPSPQEYKNYPPFIFFDDDLKLPHKADEWTRVALVSLPFNKFTNWKGNDALKRKERKVLKHVIDSVHTAGKRIRFWAAPDTEISWKWQKKLGVDLIGTDKISELGSFLRKED
jgi:alkaline phosphatase